MLHRFAARAAVPAVRCGALGKGAPPLRLPSAAVGARNFAKASMAQIKELREQTAAPIGECKKALEASDGDISKAFDWLRKKGAAKASDLGSRDANEGLVAIVTGGTSEAAMVQLTCETDFSARNDTLQEFVAAVAASAQEHAPPPPGPGVFDVSVEALLQCHLKGRSGGATVGDGLAETVGKIRENITVAKVGEGLRRSSRGGGRRAPSL